MPSPLGPRPSARLEGPKSTELNGATGGESQSLSQVES
jgi:hypothetical protein